MFGGTLQYRRARPKTRLCTVALLLGSRLGTGRILISRSLLPPAKQNWPISIAYTTQGDMCHCWHTTKVYKADYALALRVLRNRVVWGQNLGGSCHTRHLIAGPGSSRAQDVSQKPLLPLPPLSLSLGCHPCEGTSILPPLRTQAPSNPGPAISSPPSSARYTPSCEGSMKKTRRCMLFTGRWRGPLIRNWFFFLFYVVE